MITIETEDKRKSPRVIEILDSEDGIRVRISGEDTIYTPDMIEAVIEANGNYFPVVGFVSRNGRHKEMKELSIKLEKRIARRNLYKD